MKHFLEHVAEDLIAKYGENLSQIVVVFPNKRASLFMNDYLAKMSARPVWCPTYKTISELFRENSKLIVGDRIKLICDLHKVFTRCTGIDETLDHFYGWGELLLSDFDDIDKNMADAEKIFIQLQNIHELDDISYLSDEQKETLKQFFSNFTDDHNTEIKKRFMNLWSHFGTIYTQYNSLLEEQGLAYEGALYRKVITDNSIILNDKTYVFVGFNALQKVEAALFEIMKNEHKALFYWDYDIAYRPGSNNKATPSTFQEASFFINNHLDHFKNELNNNSKEIYDNWSKHKDITIISAKTENIQARYVTQWLSERNRIKDKSNTAIVLCNENLLHDVANSIPEEVKSVNITMGYPLILSPVSSLVTSLFNFRTVGKMKQNNVFRLKYVNEILRHPYMIYISEKANDIFERMNSEHIYFPTYDDLAEDENLEVLFKVFEKDTEDNETAAILEWMIDVLGIVGTRCKDKNDPFLQESVFRMYTLINRLYKLSSTGDLIVNHNTCLRLINQLIRSTSVPFHGEPIEGIQIMGVLETRNLDFEHILILSCNEKRMPKINNDTSFIPYNIRKAFGLTTTGHKVAIYAYYFYRLLQRSGDITITYSNATDDGHAKEMSRLLLQLLVDNRLHIKQKTLQGGQAATRNKPQPIAKDEETLKRLYAIERLSPTTINKYLSCQLKFYYHAIAQIREQDDIEIDEIDNRLFGNLFHRAVEILYGELSKGRHLIEKEVLEATLKSPHKIAESVDQAFKKEIFKTKDAQRTPEYNGLQAINREVVIEYLKKLLRIDISLAPFYVIGLEENIRADLSFQTPRGTHKLEIGGIIDRLDRVKDEQGNDVIRIIDYKTGRKSNQKVNSLDDIFGEAAKKDYHTGYYLQTILYATIVRTDKKLNPTQHAVVPALIYIQQTGDKDYTPVIKLNSAVISDIEIYRNDFQEKLKQLLEDIYNPEKSFLPTDNQDTCDKCPYRRLCRT